MICALIYKTIIRSSNPEAFSNSRFKHLWGSHGFRFALWAIKQNWQPHSTLWFETEALEQDKFATSGLGLNRTAIWTRRTNKIYPCILSNVNRCAPPKHNPTSDWSSDVCSSDLMFQTRACKNIWGRHGFIFALWAINQICQPHSTDRKSVV